MILRRLLLLSLLCNAVIPQGARACQTSSLDGKSRSGRCAEQMGCDRATGCVVEGSCGPFEAVLCYLCPCDVPREPIDPTIPAVPPPVLKHYTLPPVFAVVAAVEPPPAVLASWRCGHVPHGELAHNDRRALLAVWLK